MSLAHNIDTQMGAAPTRTLRTQLRYVYRYVRDARELRQQVGALSATFPIEGPRGLQYYGSLGGDRAVVKDAVSRVDETDVVWDLDTTWGAYTAYLGRVCERVVTVARPGRGDHLRRVVSRNDLPATVVVAPAGGAPDSGRDAGGAGPLTEGAEPTVVRLNSGELLDSSGSLGSDVSRDSGVPHDSDTSSGSRDSGVSGGSRDSGTPSESSDPLGVELPESVRLVYLTDASEADATRLQEAGFTVRWVTDDAVRGERRS